MKDINKIKREKYFRRQKRSRSKIVGTSKRPRLSVFRSISHIYIQAIDDIKNATLITVSDKEIKNKGNKVEIAGKVGEVAGKKLQEKKISEIIFDKGAYKYHGRVKALAEGIRKQGIKF